MEPQIREGRVSEFGRYRPSETVAMEVQGLEVRQVSEFGRYRPSETVAMEAQRLEVRQVSEFGWYRPTKTVVTDGQVCKFGQVCEFWWQCAVQWRSGRSRDEEQEDARRGSSHADSSPAPYRSCRVPVEGAGPPEGIPRRPENFAICNEPGVRLIGYDGSGIAWMRLSEDIEQ